MLPKKLKSSSEHQNLQLPNKKIRFDVVPDKQQLLDLSKLIGFTASETYRLFQKGLPVYIDDVPMVNAYKIRKYFRAANITVTVTPAIDQYHLFENCWNI